MDRESYRERGTVPSSAIARAAALNRRQLQLMCWDMKVYKSKKQEAQKATQPDPNQRNLNLLTNFVLI